jgi:predicted nucleic acid-binding protein
VTTFVDTSALYALLDEDDRNHRSAAGWLSGPGRDPAELLLTHNYVLVESAALLSRRLGSIAVRALLERIVPALLVVYVDELLHRNAVAAYLAGIRRRPSLVDWVSFQLMRERQLVQAFAFDRDFLSEGFRVVP